MKFFYNGQLVRTSKTHEYTHAVVRVKDDGSVVVWGCSSTLEGAMKQINKARGINPAYQVVALERSV